MNTPLVLPTEKQTVVLRQLTVGDAPAYFSAVDANRDHLSQFGDETAAKYPDLQSVVNSIVNPNNPDKIRMGIWDGDTFVGSANLTPDEDGQATEIGYWLDARHEGHGYASMAANAMAKYGKEHYGKVYAHVSSEPAEDGERVNDKSVRVLERAGFKQTAREVGKLTFELVNQAPERLGSDIDTQFDWVKGEMGYSRDKVKGYEEKLVRLGRAPNDPTSVFGFMSNYWHRFSQAADTLNTVHEPLAASRALQASAKVVAGLSDKVAFALWLEDRAVGATHDPEWLIDTALGIIRERVEQTAGEYTDEQLLACIDKPFEENPMGQAILALHQEHGHNPNDTEILRIIAVEGSAWGILMSQAYSRSLEQKGLSSVMPKPGISSGNIEIWD